MILCVSIRGNRWGNALGLPVSGGVAAWDFTRGEQPSPLGTLVIVHIYNHWRAASPGVMTHSGTPTSRLPITMRIAELSDRGGGDHEPVRRAWLWAVHRNHGGRGPAAVQHRIFGPVGAQRQLEALACRGGEPVGAMR